MLLGESAKSAATIEVSEVRKKISACDILRESGQIQLADTVRLR